MYLGRSKGFGFVTFAEPEEAQKAVDTLNSSDLDGRSIRVNIATGERRTGGGGGFGGDRGDRGGDRGSFRRNDFGGGRREERGPRSFDREDGGARRSYGGGSRPYDREGGRRSYNRDE